MEIIYKDYLTFNDLKETSWRGAIKTLEIIEENNKEEELMELLNEISNDDNILTRAEINNFLWFDSDNIFEILEIESEE